MLNPNYETRGEIKDQAQALAYLLGGKAIFTVKNEETGNRYTFKVEQPKPEMPHFVRVLTGPDNGGHWTYLGAIFNAYRFRLTRASKMSKGSTPVRAFGWIFHKLQKGELPSEIHFWHEGRCGRCGRRLTVPESIKAGFGPICITKIGR